MPQFVRVSTPCFAVGKFRALLSCAHTAEQQNAPSLPDDGFVMVGNLPLYINDLCRTL